MDYFVSHFWGHPFEAPNGSIEGRSRLVTSGHVCGFLFGDRDKALGQIARLQVFPVFFKDLCDFPLPLFEPLQQHNPDQTPQKQSSAFGSRKCFCSSRISEAFAKRFASGHLCCSPLMVGTSLLADLATWLSRPSRAPLLGAGLAKDGVGPRLRMDDHHIK